MAGKSMLSSQSCYLYKFIDKTSEWGTFVYRSNVLLRTEMDLNEGDTMASPIIHLQWLHVFTNWIKGLDDISE